MYRPGAAELIHARLLFYRGRVKKNDIVHAEQLARDGKNRGTLRSALALRGEFELKKRQWAIAAESLNVAVSMAREIGDNDAKAETQFSIAKFHLHQIPNPKQMAEQLAQAREVSHHALAELWFAIGDCDQAKKYALVAYKRAWNDGEPYVSRYGLNKAEALLKQLGTEIPKLPPYDPQKDKKLLWEDEVSVAIEKLRSKKKPKNPRRS